MVYILFTAHIEQDFLIFNLMWGLLKTINFAKIVIDMQTFISDLLRMLLAHNKCEAFY